MLEVTRLKSTKEIVQPITSVSPGYTLCLFTFDKISKNGNRGHIQPVRNDKLQTDRKVFNLPSTKPE